MSPRKHRADLIPNANNPRLLQRLVRLVASGIRRQRALAEVLGVELRTVHYYTQAGEWLGLLDTDREVHLTTQGVAYAFAEARLRPKLYASAVWNVPLVQALMSGRGDLPSAEVITSFILENEPSMSPRTARRRATALRGLLAPALRHRPRPTSPKGQQMSFLFASQGPGEPNILTQQSKASAVNLKAGNEHNPDVYARLLTALLDHGEITNGQIRALLDTMGARDCPLGGYVELATRRHDVSRHSDRLVVTASAASRREFAADGVLIALTDPLYRDYLAALLLADQSPQARRDRTQLSKRFSAWDQRIFGQSLTEDTVEQAILKPLVGRRLDSLPTANAAGLPPIITAATFLDSIDSRGLMVAFPSSLRALHNGVAGVNSSLTRHRTAPAGVRLPSPVDTRVAVHGGLLFPGETPPRSIPDNLTLRLRMLTHCPAFSMLSALLLLDRKENVKLRLLEDEDGPSLHWGKIRVGTLLEAFDRFAASQAWLVVRPLSGGLLGTQLVDTGVATCICSRVGKRVVLNEQLFLRLQEDAEARVTYDALTPLEDRLHAWLDEVSS